MFPGRAKSAGTARAASARVGRASPPPCRETLFLRPELTCKTYPVLGIGMPGSAEWDWSWGILEQRKLSRFARAHGHARLLPWVWACTCMWFESVFVICCIPVRCESTERGLGVSLALNAPASLFHLEVGDLQEIWKLGARNRQCRTQCWFKRLGRPRRGCSLEILTLVRQRQADLLCRKKETVLVF